VTPEGTVAHTVDGLEASAEILVDRWGVPHIYASSAYDAFLTQGFNAARDRLWQISHRTAIPPTRPKRCRL
jgi:penicillin G amidase